MTVMTVDGMPIVTLANGLRVGNFSSPHSFTFTTGEVLPRCSPERVENSKLLTHEKSVSQKTTAGVVYVTVDLTWELSPECMSLLDEARVLHINQKVDIVLIPLPVMTPLRTLWGRSLLLHMPFRVIRSANRETKEIYPDRFCI